MNEKRPQAYGRRLGYLEALCAACLWGSSGIFSVHLFRMGVPPESVALLRSVVGALVLVAVFGVLGLVATIAFRRITRRT